MLPEAVRLPATLGPRLRRVGEAAGLVAVAAFVVLSGAALMAISAVFDEAGPYVAIALPAFPVIVLAILVNPLLGVLAVLATFPVGSIGASFGFATLQAAEAAVIFIALVVVLRRLAVGRTPLPFAPELFWVMGLLAWMLLSLYSAINEALALKAFVSLSGGIVFACVVLAVVRGPRDIRVIATVFVFVSVVISAVAVSSGSAFETTHGGAQVSGRLEGAFDHPNQLGALCAMAAPIAAALLFAARGVARRLLAVAALGLILGALGLSLSRGAWFGAGLAFLLMLVTLREARRLMAIISIPVVIVGIVVWTAAAQRPEIRVVGERARSFTTLSPYDARDEIWSEAIRQIKEDPLTGQGPGSFSVASTRVGGGATTVRATHAHNIWLNWGAEVGLGGVAFLTGLMVSLAAATHRAGRLARSRGQPRDRVLFVGIAAALLSVLGQGVFDYPLTNPVVHLAVWCLIGLLLAAARPSLYGAPA